MSIYFAPKDGRLMKKITNSERIRRKELGLRLKKFREICNLSQTDIAYILHPEDGLDGAEKSGKAFISRIESGKFALSDEDAEKITENIRYRIDRDENNICQHITSKINLRGFVEPIYGSVNNASVMNNASLYPDPDYLTGKSSYYNKEFGKKQQTELTKKFVTHLFPIIKLLGYQILDPYGNPITTFAMEGKSKGIKCKADKRNEFIYDLNYIADKYAPLYKITEEAIIDEPYPEKNVDSISLRLEDPNGKIVIIHPSDFHNLLLTVYQNIDIYLKRAVQQGKSIDDDQI